MSQRDILRSTEGNKMSKTTKPPLDLSLEATSNEGSSFRDHGKRISQFGECKKRSREMGKYILNHGFNTEQDLGLDVLGCASYLQFNHYYTIDQVKLVGAQTCKKHMLCPFCARARAAKMIQRYKERFDIIFEENPRVIPAFLTLTVKNGSDLKERYLHLKKSYKKLLDRRRKYLKSGRGYTELSKSTGGVHSFEFTNSKEKGWHPHIHSIVLLDRFIDIKALTEEWKKITGDSMNLDIRLITKDNNGSLIESLLEVFKYALKFSSLELQDNLTAYRTLRGQRLQSAYGSLWGIKIPESDLESPLADLPYLELFYKYFHGGYSLQKAEKKQELQIP